MKTISVLIQPFFLSGSFDSFVAINSQIAQFFFYAEQLVVFGHAVGTAQRTGLDLSAVGGYGDVSDGCVFRFTGSVGRDGSVSVTVGHFDSIKRFTQRTNLVHLDENRIGASHGDTL